MKKRRKGRQIDHSWRFIRYKDDVAIYASCKCGYTYACYKIENIYTILPAPEKLHPYCPSCGSRKKTYTPDVVKVNVYLWGEPWRESYDS